MKMQEIFVSVHGDDKNNGLSAKTPVRSLERAKRLCKGGQEIRHTGTDAEFQQLRNEHAKRKKTK